ncbi:capsular polysaccharide export protein [Kushneria sinocarnis]|uniref:Capsular polysaccharide export protein n=1 Tax=Kushneria sinocarnis TaxID=595502 RepID=A0A420WX33_9GAMM|nr:capsular polysaccharide biosynthesis protein [Kushneria sinocarnis]RKR04247.1 capsular polysaccharide export protein [Kushneria sinocarnis]
MTVAISPALSRIQGITGFFENDTVVSTQAIGTVQAVFFSVEEQGSRAYRKVMAQWPEQCWFLKEGPFAPYQTLSQKHETPLSFFKVKAGIDDSDWCEPSSDQHQRIERFIEQWRASRVSWRNGHPRCQQKLPERFILGWLDHDDVSAGKAQGREALHQLMESIAEHGDDEVDVVVSCNAIMETRCIEQEVAPLRQRRRVIIINTPCHVHDLLIAAEQTHVVNSWVGLDARMRLLQVHVAGRPPYHDQPSLTVLLHTLLFERTLLRHPEHDCPTTPEALLEWLALQRCHLDRFPATLYALGFSRWKLPVLKDYFQGSQIHRITDIDTVPDDACLVVWGSRALDDYPGAEKLHQKNSYQIVRLEDAFIRSVGLGAHLIRPISWVLDEKGLYYDARTPSALENILQHHVFSESDIRRAAQLRQRLIETNITKYNVGSRVWRAPDRVSPIILVPGQVESDASIRFGAQTISRNMDLLKSVRAAHPQGYILYKPHPDVLAQLRAQGMDEEAAIHHCDELVTDAPMAELLDVVDEVHVMTSLAGFEGLLRGKKVVTYGQPFYASWGLTIDHAPLPRRERRLSLDELVAGTLLHYPTYVSLGTGFYMTAEDGLEQLLDWKKNGTYNPSTLQRIMVKARRKILDYLKR